VDKDLQDHQVSFLSMEFIDLPGNIYGNSIIVISIIILWVQELGPLLIVIIIVVKKYSIHICKYSEGTLGNRGLRILFPGAICHVDL
jgi:hypothetical protein